MTIHIKHHWLLFSAIFLLAVGCKKDKAPVNAAPTAANLSVTGNPKVGEVLTATYTYNDAESEPEGASLFAWYAANDASGAGATLIAGANAKTFNVTEAESGKFIAFAVTPKALSGNLTGTETKSTYVGPVAEATTVTFLYNGASVTYNILTSVATGKRWMDRNLGAGGSPSSSADFANYGDLFQWGRAADGHQLVTRTDAVTATLTATTLTLATSATPGHAQFILAPDAPSDWLSTQNSNLWQGADGGTNNPCPTGWRLPTKAEWDAEAMTNLDDAYSKLKITPTGDRFATADGYKDPDRGIYWTSTVDETADATRSARVSFRSATYSSLIVNRASGLAVRCIKN